MSGPVNNSGVSSLIKDAWANGGKKKPKDMTPQMVKTGKKGM